MVNKSEPSCQPCSRAERSISRLMIFNNIQTVSTFNKKCRWLSCGLPVVDLSNLWSDRYNKIYQKYYSKQCDMSNNYCTIVHQQFGWCYHFYNLFFFFHIVRWQVSFSMQLFSYCHYGWNQIKLFEIYLMFKFSDKQDCYFVLLWRIISNSWKTLRLVFLQVATI